MPKSSKPKKEEKKVNIKVEGSVIASNILVGDNNTVIQETIKTAYGLPTIPQPVIDFTGRAKEIETLKASFKDGAIITGVTGGGGIGKTELARKLASEIADDYPSARMSIDLLGTSETPLSPEDAMRRLLEPLYPNQKLPDEPAQLMGLYQQTFASQKSLLLLDNAKDENQVRPLIPPKPSAVIITSRKYFSLTEFGLNPLRLDALSPEDACDLLRNASLKLHEAIDNDLDSLAKLCGNLPLALRVAASLLNDRDDWTISTLQRRLEDEQTRLKRLKRDGDMELDVEATLSLSYNLLDENLKQKFRQLGIFTAPFVNISAQAVWQIEDETEADDLLGKFKNLSLLNSLSSTFKRGDGGDVIYQYTLHDLTRLFAADHLLDHDAETRSTVMLYANHFLGWASAADDLYEKGNENILAALAQFRFIWAHLQSAYERLLPGSKSFPRPDEADRWLSNFPGKCPNVLDLHLPPRQKIPLLEDALKAAKRLGERQTEGVHLGNLGNAYAALGDARKAIEFYEAQLVIVREIGDRRGEGAALGNLGNAYADLGDARKAIEFYEQALVIDREIGDRRGEGNALGNLGLAYAALGDARKAIEFYEQRMEIAREIGDRRGEGAALGNLGNAHADLGDARKAIEFYEAQLVINREIGDRRGEGNALGNLGLAYADLGDARKAIEFYEAQLVIDREIGDRRGEGAALGNLGNAYADLGDARKAIEFYEQALVIDREIGDRRGEGNALGNLGNAYADLGDARKAIEFYEAQLVIVREIGDRRGEGNALGNLGNAYADLGDARKAIEFYEAQLVIVREIGDRRGEGAALGNLGLAYAALGDARKAIEFYEAQLVIVREIGDRRGEGAALGNLGLAYAALGDARKAIEFYEAQLVINREIGDRRGEGNALGNLGNAYADLGDARKAIEFYEQRMEIAREIGDRRGEGNALGNLGNAYKRLGEKEKAKKVWERALEIFRAIESPHVNTVENWLANLDGEDNAEKEKRMSIDDFIRMVFQVVRSKHPEAEQLFAQLAKMAVESNQPPEIQALAKVLRDVMAGIKNPDLLPLPEELAKLVKEELEKK